MDHARRTIILEQLAAVLASEAFRGAERSRALLTFLVERALAGEAERLKEYTLGVEALGRGESFDPRTDPIVRAEVSRLRRRLEQYYDKVGSSVPLMIVLPRGSYAPQFKAGPAAIAPRDGVGRTTWLALGVAIGAVGVAVAFFALLPTARPPTEHALELDVELRVSDTIGSEVGTDVVIAPDGTRIAFVTHDEQSHSRLNMRRLDDPKVSELAGTDGARAPFFSPDGRWVGFWANGAVKKVAVDGGPAVVIAESADLLGAAWRTDDTIIAATRYGVLASLPAAGGAPKTVLDLTGESAVVFWPQLLPGGDRVLVTVVSPNDFNGPTLEVVSLRDGARRAVFHGGTFGRYIEKDGQGYLLYVNQGALFALPFDVARLAATGPAFPVFDNVAYSPNFGYAQLDVSATGTLVYRRDLGDGRSIAAWIDRAGRVEPLALPPGRYFTPHVSPDGRSVAVSAVESGVNTTLVYEPLLDRTTRLHTGMGSYAWLPDGRGFVLGSTKGLVWLPFGDNAEPRPLTTTSGPAIPWSFAPDGRLAYHTADASTHFDLWTVPLEIRDAIVSAGAPEPFLQTAAIETWPTFSPDGHWIAYGSNASGTFEVYVRTFPDTGAVTRVSDSGGRMATWAHNGRELLYRTDDGHVMVVEYSTVSGAFRAGKPKRWTPMVLADTGVAPTFDIARDDERIVGLVPAPIPGNGPGRNEITLIFDVFAKLRR
jgi:serine/threonine-protein kinase